MKYLLDTNICIYWLNGDLAVEGKALQAGIKNCAISFITLSELYYGAYKSQKVNLNLTAIKSLEDKLERVDSNEEICETFGSLKAELEENGNIIDDADIFIACCALENDCVLVTNNEKHFSRIKPKFTTKIATSLMGSGFPKKLLDVIQNKLFFCESGQKFVLFGTRRVIFRADFPK